MTTCPHCPHAPHPGVNCAEVTHAHYAPDGHPIQFTLCGCTGRPFENWTRDLAAAAESRP